MKEELERILNELNLPLSTIEKELGFSNGLLGKAKKGETKLSEEKLEILKNFHESKFPKPILAGIKETNGHEHKPETVKAVVLPKIEKKDNSEKMKTLRLAIEKIDKDFGKGSVQFIGDEPLKDVQVISTGSISLDNALGVGGLPKGRIVEIYGQESSGKTTIALHVIKEAQKKKEMCAFIDVEHSFDNEYAKSLGIDIDELMFAQPDHGEQALEIADRLILTGAVGVIVIDSVAALVPKSELEGEMGDSKMGLQARLMSQACRKMVGSIAKTNCVCIFINQMRDVIGGMPYAPQHITTGGKALKFYASVRLDVSKVGQIKDGDLSVGNKIKVKVAKNKVAPPFKIAEFDLIFGKGIDTLGEIIDIATERGIIGKSGSWYSYEGSKIGQGREQVKQLLTDNPEVFKEISFKINQ